MHIGCLILFLLVFGFSIIAAILNFIGRSVTKVGEVAVWLYESFLNLLRREKKEVINPFSGESNFDHIAQDKDITYSPTETRPKRYEATDGEPTEYVEIHRNS